MSACACAWHVRLYVRACGRELFLVGMRVFFMKTMTQQVTVRDATRDAAGVPQICLVCLPLVSSFCRLILPQRLGHRPLNIGNKHKTLSCAARVLFSQGVTTISSLLG